MQDKDSADVQSGYYYVSVVDGSRYGFLLGPFENDHQRALDLVGVAKTAACAVDPRACWYAYGTCRLPLGVGSPPRGLLNECCGITLREGV